jgi:hypothetical protein
MLCVNDTPHSKFLLVLTALVSYSHVCRYTHARDNIDVESAMCQYTCDFDKFAGTHPLLAGVRTGSYQLKKSTVVDSFTADIFLNAEEYSTPV